ncbi:tpp1 [Symbiodinium natans]|uniref:subtilisin n=1 Tax=Symbiodinium natans TaxID=878477 RepID=A0A812UKP4_9DINO|nr:tpp1 [Symbiodinium natans]
MAEEEPPQSPQAPEEKAEAPVDDESASRTFFTGIDAEAGKKGKGAKDKNRFRNLEATPAGTKIMEHFGDLTNLANSLDVRMEALLREHEQDFFLAYKTHMYTVQKEIKALRHKAEQEEAKTREDTKIKALEGELVRKYWGRRHFTVVIPCTARLLVALSPVLAASVSVEKPPPVPAAWEVAGRADPAEQLELTFALRQQNLDKLDEVFWRVSTPSSSDYGQHWSNEAVNRLTAPRSEHVAAVRDFLRRFGAEAAPATPNGDFLVATVTVEVAEKMLNASYMRLAHGSGQTLLRAPGGYELPPEVAAAVDFVAPTVHVPGVRRPPLEAKPDPTLFDSNSPKHLRSLYNVDAEGKAASNRMAVTAFLEQGYSERSLEAFWKLFCGGITCGKGAPKLVGDYVAGSAGVESMLDIETITGVAGNVEAEFWGFSGRSKDNPKNEPFLKWLTTLSSTGDKDVPKVFSTSYGEDEGSWSYEAAQRLNVEFQKERC